MAKVLIVEDETDVAALIGRRLRARYDVCYAGDAITAISAARREHPDVILLDLGLPAGNGLLVMERLQNLPDVSRTPVVVVTASAVASHRAQAFEAGASGYITKPFRFDTLVAAVEHALDG
jgi:DNA-binding response OmpR family regulator